MKIPFERLKSESQYLPPWFYGSAYFDHVKAYQIFYPIPFNYLVRFFREIKYFWDRFRSQSTWIDQQIEKLREEMWREYCLSSERELIFKDSQELKLIGWEQVFAQLIRYIEEENHEAEMERIDI